MNKISRGQFIKSSLTAGAAMAVAPSIHVTYHNGWTL